MTLLFCSDFFTLKMHFLFLLKLLSLRMHFLFGIHRFWNVLGAGDVLD